MNGTKKKVISTVLFLAIIFTPLFAMSIAEGTGIANAEGTYERSLVPVNFETEYTYTGDVAEGISALVSLGSDGIGEEVRYVVRENGRIISDELITVRTLKETKNQAVLMGTKKQTVYASGNYSATNTTKNTSYDGVIAAGGGNFICPVKGYVFSSAYGPRNGRLHKGVDLAAPSGTTISASDGGTVIFSGSSTSYGKLVIVDHGNGYKTYYAHCNTILVSSGDNVTQGQSIATVGRTGNATCTHVHFEIRLNDSCTNPANHIAL